MCTMIVVIRWTCRRLRHHVVCALSATWGFGIHHHQLQLLIGLDKDTLEQSPQPMTTWKVHEVLPFTISSRLLCIENLESTYRSVISM